MRIVDTEIPTPRLPLPGYQAHLVFSKFNEDRRGLYLEDQKRPRIFARKLALGVDWRDMLGKA